MKPADRPTAAWKPCPTGQVQRLVNHLQARRRAARLRRAGGLATAGVLAAVFAGIYLYARELNHVPDYGGIACRRVLEVADDYIAGTLDADTADRIDQHLKLCIACRGRIAALRNPAADGDDPCHGQPGCDPAQPSVATIAAPRPRSQCD